ncbi:MAG TPA: TIGR03564 family F420-dependent LLM class oxidoreductase [Acidimicrobiales bacterium]|nr:TIGR03564 family F420-dependent LLM class oxidoreductase [Acidimicrobiales bacterium]
MRIGALIDVDKPLGQLVDQVHRYADAGFDSAWAVQIFGYDALTLLGVVGAQVPGITLGTAVVPVYSRHPQAMAQQALTVQAATAGRLVLGIGLSHQVVVEGLWGLSYDRPARYLKEYLAALLPMLHGQAVRSAGEVVTANTYSPLEVPDADPPPVLVAALGPTMLHLAGRRADGTVTWMTGTGTVADHIVPTITEAAAAAGRPAPRVGVSLPVTVTADVDAARKRIDDAFAIYPSLPSYRAMLDREGAAGPSDIALVGDDDAVAAGLRRLADAGATDFVASVVGTADERARTTDLLAALARG